MGNAGLSDLSYSRHMYIHGQIENEILTALVDTGASGFAFASKSLCNRLKVNPIPLPSAIALVGFEGKKGSDITHKIPLRFILGNHVESFSAYVTESCKYDLVLGLPWLEMHAPFVDWKENTITFGESCLLRGCCQFETTIQYTNSKTPLKTVVQTIQKTPSVPQNETPPLEPCKPAQISAPAFDALS